MSKIVLTLLACSVLLLTASCGGSSDDPPSAEPPGAGQEGEGQDDVGDDQPGSGDPDVRFDAPLDEADVAAIVAAVRERTASDGASYDFEAMEPLVTERDETIEFTFRYRAEDTSGGAPIAVISRRSGDITSIRYTR